MQSADTPGCRPRARRPPRPRRPRAPQHLQRVWAQADREEDPASSVPEPCRHCRALLSAAGRSRGATEPYHRLFAAPFPMARPGLEPGTPRFSVVRPCRLNVVCLQRILVGQWSSRASGLPRILRSFPLGYGRRREPSAFSLDAPLAAWSTRSSSQRNRTGRPARKWLVALAGSRGRAANRAVFRQRPVRRGRVTCRSRRVPDEIVAARSGLRPVVTAARSGSRPRLAWPSPRARRDVSGRARRGGRRASHGRPGDG